MTQLSIRDTGGLREAAQAVVEEYDNGNDSTVHESITALRAALSQGAAHEERDGITTLGEQRAYQQGYDAGRADATAPAMELVAHEERGLDARRLARLVVSYADLTHDVVRDPNGDWRDITAEWRKVVDECRAFLATPEAAAPEEDLPPLSLAEEIARIRETATKDKKE